MTSEVVPYQIDVPEATLQDLRERLDRTRWASEVADVGWDRGVPTSYLRELVEHWTEKFDWRTVERELNALPQIITTIDGVDVHAVHVRSPEPDATPLLLTHGWPSTFMEFADLVGPLTDPRSHGLEPRDAFHVVIPSVPGFGFSSAPVEAGWSTERVAVAWAELMERLGYPRYLAHGGDLGSVVSLALARRHPERVIGVHVTMMLTFPGDDPETLAALDPADLERLGRLGRFEAELSGYMKQQSTRPQTLAHGLVDSPVGQLAWIVEKFQEWADVVERPEEAIDRDRLLALATIYWVTASAGSSAQIYYEDAALLRGMVDGATPPPVEVPVAVAQFPADVLPAVRALAERDHSTLARWTEFDRGGHFPGLEQPALLAQDLRDFARALATLS